MGDSKRPKAFGLTAVLNQQPQSRRNTMAMGSVTAPLVSQASQVLPEEEMTRVVRQADTQPPPTVAMPPLSDPDATPPHGIEMIVVEESQLPGGERKPWRAAEVWTKRRVYGLDSTYKCVEILDRETGKPEPTHEMLGARLGGGRLRDPDKVRFSYPLPLPGMEAMFMKAKKHGYTSPVERMVVRVRVLLTAADEVAPSWDEIASRWSDPPPPLR